MPRIAASSTPISTASSNTSCMLCASSAWFSASIFSFSRQETGAPSGCGQGRAAARVISAWPPLAAASAGLLRAAEVAGMLKMNLPSNCSMLIEDCVIVTLPAGRDHLRVAARLQRQVLAAEQPVAGDTAALLSFGSLMSSATVKSTTAW